MVYERIVGGTLPEIDRQTALARTLLLSPSATTTRLAFSRNEWNQQRSKEADEQARSAVRPI
jgi:hypothetical protein